MESATLQRKCLWLWYHVEAFGRLRTICMTSRDFGRPVDRHRNTQNLKQTEARVSNI